MALSPVNNNLDPLVALNPNELLTFQLIRGTAPKTTLRVTNVSTDKKVVFKLKTTQPSWYYVRPNQQVLNIGKSEDITIILIENECDRFLDQYGTDQEEKLDKHRFLMQCKVIDDASFDRIDKLPQASRGEEFSKFWDSSAKDDRRNQRLRVEFVYPTMAPRDQSTFGRNVSITETVEGVRNRIANLDTLEARTVEGAPTQGSDGIFAELQGMRKKYDTLVEYTVHLTAERDYHFTQLEDLKKEFAREKARKTTTSSESPMKKAEKSTDKKSVQAQGFSVYVLILAVLIAFLAAKLI